MKRIIESELLHKPKKLASFYVESLRLFRYSSQLDYSKIGISKFAKDSYYDVKPIEFNGVPVVVLK